MKKIKKHFFLFFFFLKKIIQIGNIWSNDNSLDNFF